MVNLHKNRNNYFIKCFWCLDHLHNRLPRTYRKKTPEENREMFKTFVKLNEVCFIVLIFLVLFAMKWGLKQYSQCVFYKETEPSSQRVLNNKKQLLVPSTSVICTTILCSKQFVACVHVSCLKITKKN